MPVCGVSCAPGEHVASSLVPPKRDSVHVLQDHPTLQAKANAGGIIQRLTSEAIALSKAKAGTWMCPTESLWIKDRKKGVFQQSDLVVVPVSKMHFIIFSFLMFFPFFRSYY